MADESTAASGEPREPRVAVFAPSPVLVCTFEYPHDESDPEVALNVGGQGPWVARAVSALGARAILVVPLGGDTGRAAGHLLSEAPHDTHAVHTSAAIGCYVEERRHGERRCIREAPPGRFGEREIDDVYSAALTAGLDADVCVITGSAWPHLVDRTLLTRLTADLANLGRPTVVDLSGDQLEAALAGGVDWVKIAHDELQQSYGVDEEDEDALWEAAEELSRSSGHVGSGASETSEATGAGSDAGSGADGGGEGAGSGGNGEEAEGVADGGGEGERARTAGGADHGDGEAAERSAAGERRRGVIVSRAASEPTLVVAGDTRYRVLAPSMTTVDARGSGDAMTAALATGLAERRPTEDLLRRAAAAGAANAVHKGSATPDPDLVDRLAGTVEIETL